MRGSANTTARGARPGARPTEKASPFSSNTGSRERAAQLPRSGAPIYKPLRYLGRGSFGVVLLAEDLETGDKVAIKRVRYDSRLHNREIALLHSVLVDDADTPPSSPSSREKVDRWPGNHHPNIVELLGSYVTYDTAAYEADVQATLDGSMPGFPAQLHPSQQPPHHPIPNMTAAGSVYAYLEMVMSYLPMDLHGLKKHFYRHHAMPTAQSRSPPGEGASGATQATHARSPPRSTSATPPTSPMPTTSASSPSHLPLRYVKVLLFQLARALAFMHAHKVCHRDLKPANILVDPDSGRLQLCDFGSAKQILQPSEEKNVSYICSRYYRAPELLFGALHYGCEVDMWSFGCLVVELLRESGRPLFRGCTSVDQMAELFKVMGAPSKREMYAMNPQCAEALLRTHAMHRRSHSNASVAAGVADPTQMRDDDGEDAGGLHSVIRQDGFEDDCEDPLESGNPSSASLASQTAAAVGGKGRIPAPLGSPPCVAPDDAPIALGDYYDVLKIRAIPWKALFPVNTPTEAVALATALLCYVPQKRLSALEVVEHAFFEDLFAASTDGNGEEQAEEALRMPNGRLMPLAMFQITATEQHLYTEALQAKMARQAERVAAAMAKEG